MASNARLNRLFDRTVVTRSAHALWLLGMMLGTRPAVADVLYSNFDDSTVWAFGSGIPIDQPVVEWESAMRFVPTITAALDTVVVPVFTEGAGGLPTPPPGTFFGNSMQVAIYADAKGQPGALLELVDMPDSIPLWDSTTPPMPAPIVVPFSGDTPLQAGLPYWVSLIETESTFLSWTFSHSMPELPRLSRVVGSNEWQPTGLFTQAGLQVHGTPIPGPATGTALGVLMLLGADGRSRPRRSACSDRAAGDCAANDCVV